VTNDARIRNSEKWLVSEFISLYSLHKVVSSIYVIVAACAA